MQPMVSIIIPCYNDGQYLEETLASAKAQSYAQCEIIIVDDHSTEGHTKDVLESLKKQGCTVITTAQGRKGLSAARNTGIEAAQGKYILPLDSDDLIDPTYVKKAVAMLESHDAVRVCYCQAKYFGLKHGQIQYAPIESIRHLYRVPHCVTALFYKEDWQKVGGFDEEITLCEDIAFWIGVYGLGGQGYCLPETLFFYRIRKKSMMSGAWDKKLMERVQQHIYSKNEAYMKTRTFDFYQALGAYIDQEEERKVLFSYKIASRIFALEYTLRQWIKRLMGRA